MSVRWIAYVWESSPYEGRRLLLHLALADFANDEGVCFPSQRTLALKAKTTEGWTSATLRQMVRDGFLDVLDKGVGRGKRTVYRLKKTPTQLGETELGETEKTPTQFAENPHSVVSASIYKNHQEPSKKLGVDFDAFWTAYPRKVAKTAARNVFMKVMTGKDAPTMERLLSAVESYKKSQTDPRYIAHPTTWLRQGRWEDETETAAAPKITERDWDLERALDRIVPVARLGGSWAEAEEMIAGCEPRILEHCREVFIGIVGGGP